MNIINKAFLKLALFPSALYKNIGVSIPQLKAILSTKLLMDDRRPNTLQQRGRKKAKPISAATLGTMLLSGLLGVLYLFSFLIGSNLITSLTFYFSMFFFMLSGTLISDFTSVLIDVRDTFIILPKPVNDRTIVLARLLHIFIHILKIVVPMSLAGIVYMTRNSGIGGGLTFILIVLFVTAFAIFFINAVYILILRFTTPQRFQSVISYVQIVFAILIYGAYQIFPRMIDSMNLEGLDLTTRQGIFFYPIYWFACAWQVLYHLNGPASQLIPALLGVILPVASLYIVVKYLAPSFNSKLALMNSAGYASSENAPAATVRKKFLYAHWLSRMVTSSGTEKMGFLFTWKMMARSRDFKLKVYPSMGYLAVYVVIMFLNSRRISLDQIREQGRYGKIMVISALYITSFLLTMAINQMIYSEKYKAAWIYYISPLQKPGDIILGGAKAAILKFYIPLVVFITLAGLIIAGPIILPNIILGLFNELLIALMMVYAGNKIFPFSTHQNTSVKAGAFLRNISLLFVSGLIALGHFFIYSVVPVVIICAVLSILASWLMMGSIRNTSWSAIRSSYEEK